MLVFFLGGVIVCFKRRNACLLKIHSEMFTSWNPRVSGIYFEIMLEGRGDADTSVEEIGLTLSCLIEGS